MAIEPIKGFYVYDEESEESGVAKYDYESLENSPDVELGHIAINLNNGYYNSSGSIASQSDTYKEKHTDKLTCFDGMKLKVSLSHSQNRFMWIAKAEWTKNGNFSRTTVYTANDVNSYTFTYEPASNIKEVAFMFRGFDDYDFYIKLENDKYDLYWKLVDYTDGEVADVAQSGVYAFNSHVNKGINHRGYNTVAPENTIPAFALSVENGFSFVETDVRFTSDNVPVLLHDYTVDRTSNGTGNIADMTFAQARALDFGSWKSETYVGTQIPSFDEFIVFCKETGVFPYIEISVHSFTNAQVKILYDIVKKYGMEKSVTWIGYYKDQLDAVLSNDKTQRIGLVADSATSTVLNNLSALKTATNQVFLDLKYSALSADVITDCQTIGAGLEVWSIDNVSDLQGLDAYVSGATANTNDFATVKKQMALS